jgi:hypothetical protein
MITKEMYLLAKKVVESYESEQLNILVVSKRLGVNSKVCLKKHKNITGKVLDSSDVGFNHWMVKWDRTGETVREYGSDLVVC